MMKKIPRRDKMKIYGDLLAAINDEAKTQKIVLTRVQVRINVPYDRLKLYISELTELKLIRDDMSLEITDKGKKYLKEYKKILDFMKFMGLTY
jgi:predicted transcriptional regulator